MSRLVILAILIAFTQLSFAQDFRDIREKRDQIRQQESQRFAQQALFRRTTTPGQRDYDVTSYTLNLNIWPATESIDGSVIVEGFATTDGVSNLEFNLFDNMIVDSIIHTVGYLTFAHTGDIIDVQLPVPLSTNDLFSLQIYYRGNPQNVGLGSWRWAHHSGIPIISTLSEPFGAPAWWPCKDDPADKADSVFLNIDVPDYLVVASNGLLTAITPTALNRHTYSWETHYPISNYLVSLAISNYAQFNDWYVSSSGDSMELLYYVYPEHLAAAQEDFSVTDEMISAFAPLFGEYPFIEEKYGMAIFSWGGAMEHQTMTSYGAGLVNGLHSYDWINAHELAHQWFGDLITMKRWSHIWLNEGFASYSEALWMEASQGKTAYHNYMATQNQGLFAGPLWIQDSTNVSALFSNTVYDKGSWVLHMLRGVLGDSAFFASLYQYATDSSLIFGNAVTEDFHDICETVSGSDLDWFFQQWVYRAGRPDYQYDWQTTAGGPLFSTVLGLRQINLPAYKMPISIRLTGLGGDTTLTIWDSLAYQEFQFLTVWEPTDLQVDPDEWVLKNIAFVTGLNDLTPPVAGDFLLRQNYPNPFNGKTVIEFSLPAASVVSLEIFNVMGQRIVETHHDAPLPAGAHKYVWNATDATGNPVTSGLYFYRLQVDDNFKTGKMLLIR